MGDRSALPAGWEPFTVTGGQPGSAVVAGRFWISPAGYTPVDVAAARVGDPRYDEGVDCAAADAGAPAPIPAELAVILATIRHMETGGNYTVSVTTSTASGAYGFLDSSWGGYGGYARAKDAPPAVQDAKAAELALYILNRNGGDVSTIPVSWYIGHVPVGDEWDTVPRPDAGNRITPREYQRRWLNTYAELMGNPGAYAASGGDTSMLTVDTSATCRTVVVDVGEPAQPQFVLTQAQSFLVDAAGRAVPDAVDPCDPGPACSRGTAAGRARRRRGRRPRRSSPSSRNPSPSRRPALVDPAPSTAAGSPSCTTASAPTSRAAHPRSAELATAGRRRTSWPASRWRGCGAGRATSRCSSPTPCRGASATSTASSTSISASATPARWAATPSRA